MNLKRIVNGPLDQFVRDAKAVLRDGLVEITPGPATGRLRAMPTRAFYRKLGDVPAILRWPPPWHPLQLALAVRGHNWTKGTMPYDFSTYTQSVSIVTFWPLDVVRVMYHLLTPFNTNYHANEAWCDFERQVVYDEFDVPHATWWADRAVKFAREQFGSGDMRLRFWGIEVSTTTEVIL